MSHDVNSDLVVQGVRRSRTVEGGHMGEQRKK